MTDHQRFLSKTFPPEVDHEEHAVEDPVERRKRLTRLRQRAWRHRRRAAYNPSIQSLDTDSTWKGYGMLISSNDHQEFRRANMCFPTKAVIQTTRTSVTANERKLIPPLIPYSEYFPASRVRFPLSPDHCLLTIVQYNVLRAMIWNLEALAMLHHIPMGCADTFGVPVHNITPNPGQTPPDLQWTPLQRSVEHPYWISVIPFPSMRDNLILMSDKYDARDLLYDIGQGLYEGFDDAKRRGFIVWKDPWCASSWEVSEGFVQKWGFLLKGCSSEIETTNRWRELRGEEKIAIEM